MLSWSQVLKEQEAGWRLDMTYLCFMLLFKKNTFQKQLGEARIYFSLQLSIHYEEW